MPPHATPPTIAGHPAGALAACCCRETLRQLERTALEHAAGGLTPACTTAKCNTAAGCNTASVCDPRCTDYTQIGTCTC